MKNNALSTNHCWTTTTLQQGPGKPRSVCEAETNTGRLGANGPE